MILIQMCYHNWKIYQQSSTIWSFLFSEALQKRIKWAKETRDSHYIQLRITQKYLMFAGATVKIISKSHTVFVNMLNLFVYLWEIIYFHSSMWLVYHFSDIFTTALHEICLEMLLLSVNYRFLSKWISCITIILYSTNVIY